MLEKIIRFRGTDAASKDRVFIRFHDYRATYAQFYRRSVRFANLFLHMRQDGPFHVGLLMENYPEFIYSLGGCAFSGAVLVGINYTQLGEQLTRMLNHMDSQLLIIEPKYIPAVQETMKDFDRIGEGRILVNTYHEKHAPLPPGFVSLDEKLHEVAKEMGPDFKKEPGLEIEGDAPLMIVFTSGTTGAPKGSVNTHGKFMSAGGLISQRLALEPDDICYFSQPLFHSSSTSLSLLPALAAGAGIAFRQRFSAGKWLEDVRQHGATSFSYVGKTMSYLLEAPPTHEDKMTHMRIAIGNGASGDVRRRFIERYGLDDVVEIYSATETGIIVIREPDDPLDSVGACPDNILILNEDGEECPPAEFDAFGRMINGEEATGEIVNTTDAGLFNSYYGNPEATESRTRNDQYWSGDLGHIEIAQKEGRPTRFLYFDGRTDDWIRYNGENFPAEPIEKFVELYPPISTAAVYGIPCEFGDDDIMCGLVLKTGSEFDPEEFHQFLDGQGEMHELWMPKYVRILEAPHFTETNKLIKKHIQKEQVNLDTVSDAIYVRDKRERAYIPFTREDYLALIESFKAQGRERFLNP
jgi:fatty-acyl-CoA synthase